LVSCKTNGPALLTALTGFVNLVLEGGCPPSVCPTFFGGRLIAIEKKSGGYRPIAVGYTLRRLVAKCANCFAQSKLREYFQPLQLGVCTSGGCEVAVHATRRFIDNLTGDNVVVKLDFTNAFNSIRRDVLLQAVYDNLPEVYRFCFSAYNYNSVLKFDNRNIMSMEGIQQGDPIGSLLFCLAIQPLLRSLSSTLRIGYLDDITLGGSKSTVNSDVLKIVESGATIGLHLNMSKCEVISSCNIEPDYISLANLFMFSLITLCY
jgi:hypothetical protein